MMAVGSAPHGGAGRTFIAAVLSAGLIALAACAPEKEADAPTTQPEEEASQPPADGPGCVAPASWFPQSQTPKPDPNVDFDSFCVFHQWAWQSFLWLTQPVDGAPRFVSFPTEQDVIAGRRTRSAGALHLAVRTQKRDAPAQTLSAVQQAGQMGVLVARNGRAGYYSQHVNPDMFDEIIRLRWNDPTVLNEIPNTTEFQVGDVELKAAWKIVEPGEETSGLFVMPAKVDKLVNEGGKITVDTSTQLDVEVALVGLHIVGWVNGHPEAIWATFENDDNAPSFVKDQSPSAPVSDRDWIFYQAHTNAIDCNQLNGAVLTLDEATQKLSPVTQVCRQYPFGMLPDPTAPNDQQNLAAITSLNESVKSQLAADNVWKNYFEVGAIWTNGDLQPNNDQQAHLIGSTLLSNAVIETFTQNVRSQNNCFSCHNTLMYNPLDPSIQPMQGTNISLSHILLEAYVANQN